MRRSDPVELMDGTLIYYTYDQQRSVSANDLRDRFNTGYYWEIAEIEHKFEQAIEYEAPPAPDTDLPSGTLSQIIIYHAERQFVAEVHQYLLPGDERDELGRPLLGGSGMPDPKELIEEEDQQRIYYIAPRPMRRPRWSA